MNNLSRSLLLAGFVLLGLFVGDFGIRKAVHDGFASVQGSDYERGKRDGIAECEKNCVPATVAGSLDLGPCSLEQEGTVSGGSEGSAFQYYYCNGSKWIVAREFNAADLDCVTRGKEKMCIQRGNGSISLVPAPVIAREVSKPIRKPAPKPKPCDPCESIGKLDKKQDLIIEEQARQSRRLSSIEFVINKPPAGCEGCAPTFCEPDSLGGKCYDHNGNCSRNCEATDSQYVCLTCEVTITNPRYHINICGELHHAQCVTGPPATPCGGLPCATMSTPPYHDLEGTTVNGTSDPTKYVAPATIPYVSCNRPDCPTVTHEQPNGPGALLLYTPPHGAPSATTPEPRALLLAAGGLGFIAWRMNR